MKQMCLLLLLVWITNTTIGQEKYVTQRDIQPEWLAHVNNNYIPFTKSEEWVSTIYFSLTPARTQGDHLMIVSANKVSILINGRLYKDNVNQCVISIDSLNKIFGEASVFFAVHQDQIIQPDDLATLIQSRALRNAETDFQKRETSFRDFVLTAVLILFVFLIGVIQLNPRLSSDYFSVTKLFSLRESDSDPFYYRLTSGNILFYLFTSLVLAFYFMVIGQFIKIGVLDLKAEGFAFNLLTWLKHSAIIFAFLFSKMFVVYVIASLFGVRDIAGFHFFNFTRLLLVFVGLMTLILSVYFLIHGQQTGFYAILLNVMSWILGGWILLLFLKLTNRVPYAVFHLFSYICATEIIPFLLIFKVLNE